MEISYNLLLPLERLSLVALAAKLWSKESIRNLICELNYKRDWPEIVNDWMEIEAKVLESAKLISLPNALKCKLLATIKPISLQIVIWMDFHVNNCEVSDPPKEFCWSSRGTIDRKGTADMLVKDETLDVKVRYLLACTYCLENNIPVLWKHLEKSYRDYAIHKQQKAFLVKYWSRQMEKQDIPKDALLSTAKNLFLCDSVGNAFAFDDMCGNETGIQYILQHFSTDERDNILMDAAEAIAETVSGSDGSYPLTEYFNSLLFVVSRMKQDQQILVCKKTINGKRVGCIILLRFLNWPFQELFMKLALSMRDVLKHGFYIDIMLNILCKVDIWEDYNYEELYIMFWQQVPRQYRDVLSLQVIEYCAFGDSRVINSDRCLKTIFSSFSVAEKQAFILDTYLLLEFSKSLFENNKQNFVQSLLEESLISKEAIAACRNNLRTFARGKFKRVKKLLLKLLNNVQANMNVEQKAVQ